MSRIPAFLGSVAVIVMIGALTHGFTGGSFFPEGRTIVNLAWGRVTLIDLYVGLYLLGAWITWRERRPSRYLPWLVGLVILGNLAAGVYITFSAVRFRSIEEFFGRRPAPVE